MKNINNVFERIFSLLFVILFIVPSAIMVLIEYVSNRIFLSKQFKKIKQAGYKIIKVKDNGKKVYLFTSDLLVIKFLPNEIHDISFDGGKTYIPIIESDIGTPQEIEHLKTMQYKYRTCDYRDRDLYDTTEEFIRFIIKNISLDK